MPTIMTTENYLIDVFLSIQSPTDCHKEPTPMAFALIRKEAYGLHGPSLAVSRVFQILISSNDGIGGVAPESSGTPEKGIWI